jgi:predicted Ser/Thr protein kinase
LRSLRAPFPCAAIDIGGDFVDKSRSAAESLALELPFLSQIEKQQVELFIRGAGLSDEHNRQIIRWWRCDRSDGQGFLEFLLKENLVTGRELRFVETSAAQLGTSNFFPIALRSRLQIKARDLFAKSRGDSSVVARSSAPTIKAPNDGDTTADRLRCIVPGAKVGVIRVDQLLGSGGFGEVYRGYHERLEISVAVKFLRPEKCSLPSEALRRIVAEGRLMARLNHPNIVRLWDFDEQHSPPYMVMEYVDGPTVQKVLAEHGPFAVKESLKIAREVARALLAAWRLGVVHRDIKPANIMLSKDGVSKVTDFGLAVLTQESSTARPLTSTYESGVPGTAEYLAPEAIKGAAPSPQSDMYSLGAMLYHMLAGRPPFTGSTSYQILFDAANKPAPSLSTFVPNVDQACRKFIHRLLAKHPIERFASYEEMFIELDAMLGGGR